MTRDEFFRQVNTKERDVVVNIAQSDSYNDELSCLLQVTDSQQGFSCAYLDDKGVDELIDALTKYRDTPEIDPKELELERAKARQRTTLVAVQQFIQAARNLEEKWQTDDHADPIFCDKYPFEQSFEDLVYKMEGWKESIEEKLNPTVDRNFQPNGNVKYSTEELKEEGQRNYQRFQSFCEQVVQLLNAGDADPQVKAYVENGPNLLIVVERRDLEGIATYWGTANENWGADIMDKDENQIGSIQTTLSTKTEPASLVASVIHGAMTRTFNLYLPAVLKPDAPNVYWSCPNPKCDAAQNEVFDRNVTHVQCGSCDLVFRVAPAPAPAPKRKHSITLSFDSNAQDEGDLRAIGDDLRDSFLDWVTRYSDYPNGEPLADFKLLSKVDISASVQS